MKERYIKIVSEFVNSLNSVKEKINRCNFLEAVGKDPSCEVDLPIKSLLETQIGEMECLRMVFVEENEKCIGNTCDFAKSVNPIGMHIPRKKFKSDDDIKSSYDKLRTVIHDDFDKSVEEGTIPQFASILLSPPKDKKTNLPKVVFDNVFTNNFVDADVEKVAKDDIIEAVKTVSEFENRLDSIIEDAENYESSYKKNVVSFNDKERESGVDEIYASMYKISESLVISCEDFINFSEINDRRNTLLENTRNAYRILYGLTTYNPRNIKESALSLDVNVDLIDMHFDELLETASNYL